MANEFVARNLSHMTCVLAIKWYAYDMILLMCDSFRI